VGILCFGIKVPEVDENAGVVHTQLNRPERIGRFLYILEAWCFL
jgi:hypothetical protein